MSNNVIHPTHYNSDPSGVECLAIVRHRNFNVGNAMKYLWRAGLKDRNAVVEDLKKAIFCIEDEIKRIGEEAAKATYAGCQPKGEEWGASAVLRGEATATVDSAVPGMVEKAVESINKTINEMVAEKVAGLYEVNAATVDPLKDHRYAVTGTCSICGGSAAVTLDPSESKANWIANPSIWYCGKCQKYTMHTYKDGAPTFQDKILPEDAKCKEAEKVFNSAIEMAAKSGTVQAVCAWCRNSNWVPGPELKHLKRGQLTTKNYFCNWCGESSLHVVP